MNVFYINFDIDYKIVLILDFKCIIFVLNEFFSVYKLDVFGKCNFIYNIFFFLYSVLDGNGKFIYNFVEYNLKKGMYFILLNDFGDFSFEGNLEIICFYI